MNIILQQMLQQIIISFLIIGWAHSLTSLTYNNCPQEFTPASYNTSLVTSSKNLAASIYGGVFSSQAQLAIQASLNTGDLQAVQSQIFSTSFLLPFILAGSIFAVLFLSAACCCTFDRRCPPCESWRRNYVKEPYSQLELRATMISAVIFSVVILVATIVIFSTFTDLGTDIRMVKCGLYYSLDTALKGDQANNWGGFAQIQAQVQNTSVQLGAAATSINSNLLGNEWIQTGMEALQDMNLALYTNNQNSVVATPNPVTTAAANLAGTPPPTIVPLFIQTLLGPNGTAGTMVTDIDSGLQVTQKGIQLSAQAYTTYVSAVGLANSASNITANTNSNLQSISIASKYLSNIELSINAFTQNFINIALNPGIYVLQAVFGVILLATLLSLLGIISSHLFDLYGCRQMVHGGWTLLGCFYFAVLGVLFIFLSVGGVSYTFCKYFQSIIGSNAGYISFASASSTGNFNKFFTYLDVCFFQDGNILKKFQLSQEMKSVSDVFLNTQTYLNMQTSGNTQYVDITIAPAKIITWMSRMNNYSLGVPIDAPTSDLTEDNPYVSLSHFNMRTNQNSTGVNTTCANDYWVFDSSHCTFGPSESQYSPSANITNGLYIPPTGSLCISLNTRISQTAPSIWTASDIAQRYLAVRSCKVNSSSAYDEIVSYAQSLTNYRDSRINLYKGISDQLSSMLTVINNYNSNMSTFTGNLSNFFSAVSFLNYVVTNQNNGLTISNNCTIIADSMRFFYNMYCVNLLNRSIKVVICCAALLVMIVGAVLVGSVFGLRYSRVQKQRRFVGQDGENEVFKEDINASVSSSNSQDSP